MIFVLYGGPQWGHVTLVFDALTQLQNKLVRRIKIFSLAVLRDMKPKGRVYIFTFRYRRRSWFMAMVWFQKWYFPRIHFTREKP